MYDKSESAAHAFLTAMYLSMELASTRGDIDSVELTRAEAEERTIRACTDVIAELVLAHPDRMPRMLPLAMAMVKALAAADWRAVNESVRTLSAHRDAGAGALRRRTAGFGGAGIA